MNREQFIEQHLQDLLTSVFGSNQYTFKTSYHVDKFKVVIGCEDQKILKHVVGRAGKNIHALRTLFNIVCKKEGFFAEIYVLSDNYKP